MATRSPYPGTQSSGQALTSANFDKLPGGKFARVSVTTDSSGTTSTELVTSVTASVADAAREIDVHVRGTLRADKASGVQVRVDMDGTQIGRFNGWTPGLNTASVTTGPTLANNADGKDWSFDCTFTCQPGSGSHVWELYTGVSGSWTGTPTVTLIADTASSSQGNCIIEVSDSGIAF